VAKKVKDIAVATGSYTNSSGEEKRRYMNCGALMEGDDGNQFIMLNRFINYSALPRKQGSESILLSIFDLREREGGGEQKAQSSGMVSGDLDDDVPF
jgi:hypothetical protein